MSKENFMNKILFRLFLTCCLIASQSSHAMEGKGVDGDTSTLRFNKNHTDRFSSSDREFFKSDGDKDLETPPARFKFGYLREITCGVDKSCSISYRVAIPNRYLDSKDKIGSVHIFSLTAPNSKTQHLLLNQALDDAWEMHKKSKPVVYLGTDAGVIAFLKSIGFLQEKTSDGKTVMQCDLQKYIEKKLKVG